MIRDAQTGLKAAIARVFEATWQRCRVHWMRNALAHVSRGQNTVIAAAIRPAFDQPDRAGEAWRKVADLMDASEHDVLVYMSDLVWLTDAEMARPEPFFQKSHGKPRVDDRRVLSGVIFINCNGLQLRDAPAAYVPHKTLYNRWKRWSDKGIFARMMAGLAAGHGVQKTAMIDATYLKAHRTATSMGVKKGRRGRLIGRTKGGMNTRLHAICDSQGRPFNLFVTAGLVSDYIGARALLSSLADVDWLLGDRGHGTHWFREALKDRGIRACIPG